MAICELDHLAAELPKRTFALVGGAFDPLHDGHLDHFWEATAHGPLVCAVTTDADLSLKHPPLLPEAMRLRVMDNLRVLQHVTLNRTGIVPILEALEPLAYVKGPDWVGRVPTDQVACCERLGIAIRFTSDKPRSSTALLDDYQRRVNAEKLAAFEAWATTQPAPVPWVPVTDYSWEARRSFDEAQAELIRDCMAPSSVLDVGCGPGHLVRALRVALAGIKGVEVLGMDSSIDDHAYGCDDLYHGDIVEYDAPRSGSDLVICREVLEHLLVRDLSRAVRNLVALSTRFVYLTTRFTAKPHLLDFDTRDDLDPTHITMLNQDYLRSLFVLEGCTRRADLEARMDWRKLGRVLVYEVPQ